VGCTISTGVTYASLGRLAWSTKKVRRTFAASSCTIRWNGVKAAATQPRQCRHGQPRLCLCARAYQAARHDGETTVGRR
jgi:hypothetical protein